jgi:Trk K+ transport system NAD-binding subunit
MQPSEQWSQRPTENAQPSLKHDIDFEPSHFLVCGLGSLGQLCVKFLKEFGVPISAIDLAIPTTWEVDIIPDLLGDLIVGDCRQCDILKQAKVEQCRAVLLVTGDDSVNIKAAFAVRKLNKKARLVVRSAQKDLNERLKPLLGNFVAYDALELPAEAIATRALGDENRGRLELNNNLVEILKIKIHPQHWLYKRPLYKLYEDDSSYHVLSHIRPGKPLPTKFHHWEPDEIVQVGDEVACIRINYSYTRLFGKKRQPDRKNQKENFWHKITDRVVKPGLWQSAIRFCNSIVQRKSISWVTIVAIVWVLLLLFGTLTLVIQGKPFFDSLYAITVMLLGAYDEVLTSLLQPDREISIWWRMSNLGLMIFGVLAIALLNSKLTEYLVSAKLDLSANRHPIPENNHIVVIGLGRVGKQVAMFLRDWNKPVVGVDNVSLEANVLPQMPLVVDDWSNALSQVNLATARSVVVATNNEMLNLEIGIMAQNINPKIPVIIRTSDFRFSHDIEQLLPKAKITAKILCIHAISAEVFVGTAFGENILELLRLNEQTILVTEYTIEPKDDLNGLLLSEIAYGYQVVPISYRKSSQEFLLMPPYNTKLQVGDSLLFLATIESLQKIEQGENVRLKPTCKLRVERKGFSDIDTRQEAMYAIDKLTGCGLGIAGALLLSQLPQTLNCPLYEHQGLLLVREIKRCGYDAKLVEA